MSPKTSDTVTRNTVKRTHFGMSALLTAILSVSFLAAYFGVSRLSISPETFLFWNVLTAFISCSTAPLAFGLAYLAWRSFNDSRRLAGAALLLTGIPFLILFIQFMLS